MNTSHAVEIYAEIKKETDKGLLVFDGEQQVWLPKSQIEFNEPNKNFETSIWIPEWLATQKGIV